MQPKFYVVICVFATFWYLSTAYVERPEREENSLIPANLKALEYELSFEMEEPEREHLFFGTAIIKLECREPTKGVILNMKNLSLDRNGVKAIKGFPNSQFESVNILEPVTDAKKERLIISLEEELQKDEIIQLQIDYHKSTSKDPDGVFLQYSYKRKTDEPRKWLALSIPGPVNARRLYPCVDEIGVKAEVIMNVSHKEELKSFGNTNIIVDKREFKTFPNSVKFVLDPYYNTPDLSTFSIGFVVGDFKSVLSFEESSGTYIQVSSDEAIIAEMAFAANTARKIVKFYKEYFNSAYPINQIDIVALPLFGETDKWYYGLILLQESLITIDESSTQIKQIETAFTLCDVLCHQYFGPQSTFESWSENWLNMGLALFYRIPCLDHLFPNTETGIANIHLVEAFIRVLSVEAEIKSRPLMLPDSRIDLTNLFKDTILAETAYFLVRMMSYSLGKDVLTEQIQDYIAEFKFKVASLAKLLKKFTLPEKNSKLLPENVTFKTVINSWTSKEGFAHIKMTRNPRDKFVTIRQKLPANSRPSPKIIPLNFITRSESMAKAVEKREAMKKSASKHRATNRPAGNSQTKNTDQEETVQYWLQSEPIKISVQKRDWIVLNSRLNVLCRVEYDPITLELIRKTLTKKKTLDLINVTSRTQFISDLFASAEMGQLSYSIVLRFMSYLKNEKSIFPIMVALHELKRIRLALFGTNVFSEFEAYVRTILDPMVQKINPSSSEDNYEEYYFKKLILTTACTFQDERCVEQSKIHFTDVFKNENPFEKTDPITTALREAFFCQAIKEAGYTKWNFLFSFYSGENWDSLDDSIILNALACTTDGIKITEYLQRILDPAKIAPKHRLTVFKSVASNEKGYHLMRSFFYDHVDELLKLYEYDPAQISRYLEIIYENTRTQEDFNDLEEFIETNSLLQDIEMHLEESKEVAKKNIEWLKNLKVEIPHFFEERKKRHRLRNTFALKKKR